MKLPSQKDLHTGLIQISSPCTQTVSCRVEAPRQLCGRAAAWAAARTPTEEDCDMHHLQAVLLSYMLVNLGPSVACDGL